MINFNGADIPGLHTPIISGSPSWQGRVTNFFGLKGASELFSHLGPRELTCQIWLASEDYTNSGLIYDEIERLDGLVGTHGTLKEVDDDDFPANEAEVEYPSCTFLGFTPEAVGGQEVPEPILGAVHLTLDLRTKWLQAGTLKWRQLVPSRTTPGV